MGAVAWCAPLFGVSGQTQEASVTFLKFYKVVIKRVVRSGKISTHGHCLLWWSVPRLDMASLVAPPREGPTPTAGSDTGRRAAGTRRRSVTQTSLANASQATVINRTTSGRRCKHPRYCRSLGHEGNRVNFRCENEPMAWGGALRAWSSHLS